MYRHVRGSLFADYIRMIRHRKDVDWHRFLSAEDLAYAEQKTDRDAWYPMAVFERLGNAILAHSDAVSLEAVRLWGQLSVRNVVALHPTLIAPGDPLESMMRLKVMRATLFDFPAFHIPMLSNGHVRVAVHYHMGAKAEEAACFQSMGFCEGVLAIAGARHIEAHFRERSWAGAASTTIDLQWIDP